ncbi:MAG: transcription termination factor Rho [bacterium]|nr:transcription termination factor Rho [Acidimicrobiia bacterium]MCY4651484.1 transcription termination factor Rho [bacterium]
MTSQSENGQLQTKSVEDLKKIAEAIGIKSGGMGKEQLIGAITSGGKAASGGGKPTPSSKGRGGRQQAPPAPVPPSPSRKKTQSNSKSGDRKKGNSKPDFEFRANEPPSSPPPGGGRRRRGRGRRQPSHANIPESELEVREGLLDILPEGYGFLRVSGYGPGEKDVYVSAGLIRRLQLRKGDLVGGPIRPPRSQEKYPGMVRVEHVNKVDPGQAMRRPKFEKLTPLFPDQRLRLELEGMPQRTLARLIDLISPVGKGQRGLIVSPPKAGKTTVLKEIAQSITVNNPECHLMVVLVDERPEEVTDMQRSVRGDVVYSTFDRPAEQHTQIADLALERAKRMVETGLDVVILLDSITRLARAHNLAAPASGRMLSGGIDATALYPPKRFFGAARNIEEGGSLTILGTALVETRSKMDEVIFEEFKGTGNMELRLDRKLADKRIYPAVDIELSGTRREELLFTIDELPQVWKLRRVLLSLDPSAAIELLIDKLQSSPSNKVFLAEVARNTGDRVRSV